MARSSKIIALVPVSLALIGSPVMAAPSADTPHGNWARSDGKAKVIVETCEGSLCAVNTWIRPGVKDEKVGDRLVMTITDGGNGTWRGKAYDPQRRLTLNFTLKVDGDRMTTTGCVWGGVLCKSMGWTRLDG